MQNCTCSLDHIDAECHKVLGSIRGKIMESEEFGRPFWKIALGHGAEHEPSCSLSPLRHKRGPKPNRLRADIRSHPKMASMSDRSFAMFYKWFRVGAELDAAGVTGHSLEEAERMATRPNGSLNVSKFARITEVRLFVAVEEHPELFPD